MSEHSEELYECHASERLLSLPFPCPRPLIRGCDQAGGLRTSRAAAPRCYCPNKSQGPLERFEIFGTMLYKGRQGQESHAVLGGDLWQRSIQ